MKVRILLILGLIMSFNLPAQKILGLWEVKRVEVGERERTPQAKWVEFSENGFIGGNGLLRNSAGTYKWDPNASSIRMVDTLGLKDPFGAFSVSWTGDTMLWERVEDEAKVRVMLVSAVDIPVRLSDKAVGIWTPKTSDSLSYMFLRWDRLYVLQYKDGRRYSGVWQSHSHRDELVFLPWDRTRKPRTFKIEQGPWNELLLFSDDKPSQGGAFNRSRTFPD